MKYHLIHQNDNNYSVLEQIFINRGFNLEDIGHYLNTTENDIHNSWLLDNIDAALELLLKHLKRPDCKVYVCVDQDYDGNSSAALFMNYLHRLFPSIVENNFVYDVHETKIHGIEIDKVPEDTTLVVAIDSSSNQYDVHEELAKRGIDILVVD